MTYSKITEGLFDKHKDFVFKKTNLKYHNFRHSLRVDLEELRL